MLKKLLVPMAASLFAATLAFGEGISVEVIPSLAPNAFGSPSWNGYVSNALYALEHGLAAYGDPSLPTYYSAESNFRNTEPLVTTFNSWMGYADPGSVFGPAFANELGNRMHFGLHVVGNGTRFSISDLSFSSHSSDPGDLLGYSWGAAPWSYSPARVGVLINPDGSRTYVTTGDQQVDELMYVGSGNSLWPLADTADPGCTGCSTSQQQAAIDAMAASPDGYRYTGTYSVLGYSGSGTFQVTPEPSTYLLLMTGLAGLAFVRRRR
jgi:hypothetical protein